MNDPVLRVAVVAIGAALALLVAWIVRAVYNKRARTLNVQSLISGPGVVVFTKDDCPNCAAVLAMLKPTGAQVRQVRAEAEPEVFAELGVEGVPITVVVSESGDTAAQFSGLPRPARLRRALRRFGEIPDSGGTGL